MTQQEFDQACAERDAEIARLQAALAGLTPEAIHHFCHDLDERVSATEFAEACMQYQEKLYDGVCPTRAKIASLTEEASALKEQNRERDAEIEKLSSALQAALVIEQETVITKDAEIANERLLLNGLRSVNVGLCEQIRQKDAEVSRLDSAFKSSCQALLDNSEKLVALHEQNRSLRALLERVPHSRIYVPSHCDASCVRCAYEAIKGKP